MQIPQSIHGGDLVEIRRQRWRVVDVRPFDGCDLLTLVGAGRSNSGSRRRFLLPFDVIARDARPRPLRTIGIRRWRRACRAALASASTPGRLRTAAASLIDLLPHQLEPALAVIRGRGTRLLLADDVGLGKTIQAGLIITELQARGTADRVLIATPAGLRDQWRGELHDRFNVDATIADMAEIRRRGASVAVGQNPWLTMPVAITSIDYLKRPEILQSVTACRWDVLVVDEAHGVGPGTDRHGAIATLAARAPYVLLLTATPHNGDTHAFNSLCDTGAHHDPLLLFRRTRQDVHLGTRRHIHMLRVRSSKAEARMHTLLAEFAAAVRLEHDAPAAWLALAVLHKRAFSSARAFELTVGRRLAALAPDESPSVRQIPLPLWDPGGEFNAADEPPDSLVDLALGDQRHESRLLRALSDAARLAAVMETKVAATRRLLRRIAEPVVVFTEFRDTLRHLASAIGLPSAMLHGGLSREERTAALAAFGSGRRRILLATDAAGEGLNLHHGCRTVINFELPWNPMRLEQRIGRVDRIGQRDAVHVFELVGGDTGENRVLERLEARTLRARAGLAAFHPIQDEDLATTRFVVDGRHENDRPPGDTDDASASAPSGTCFTVDLAKSAREEAVRSTRARRWLSAADGAVRDALDATGPWIARTRLLATRAALGGRAMAIWRVDYEDGSGQRSASVLLPVMFRLPPGVAPSSGDVTSLVGRVAPALQAHVDSTTVEGHDEIVKDASAFAIAYASRLQRIAASIAVEPIDPWQTGLFDRRAERARAASRAFQDAVGDTGGVIDYRHWHEPLRRLPAQLLLVLVG